MASSGYTYTNDLDDGDLVGTIMRPHEQSSSSFVDSALDNTDTSQSQYEYLDSSFSESYDDGRDEALAALALEDFVGVDGSNLASALSGSNSAFEISDGEGDAQTQTSNVTSQSVSGTDFDALPIIPVARQTIEELPAALVSVPQPLHHYHLRMNAVGDLRQPSTPYLEVFRDASSPAAGPNSIVRFNASPNGGGTHHRSAKDRSNHSDTNAVMSTGYTSNTPTLHSRTATAGGPTYPSVEPTPPLLHPVLSSTYPHNDSERFRFGIDAFLHGNKLGFGRQPSFKRLTPAAQSESKKNNCVLRFDDGGTSTSGAAPVNKRAAASSSSAGARVGLGGDQSAEAFNTWLEELESKAPGPPSARSGFSTTHAGLSIGEKLKREVDALMKNLLGDYDIFAGATTAVPGGSQPAHLDTFPGGTRTFSSTMRLPSPEVGQAKQQAGQSSASGFRTLLARQPKLETSAGIPSSAGGEQRGSAGAFVGASTTAFSSSQSQAQGSPPSRHGQTWSTPSGSRKTSASSAMAGNGDVFPDPTAAAATKVHLAMAHAKLRGSDGSVTRACGSASLSTATPYPYVDEDLLEGGYITGPPQLIRSPVKSSSGKLSTAAVASGVTSTGRDCGAHNYSNTTVIPTLSARGRGSSLVGREVAASKQRPFPQQQRLHPSWRNLPHGNSDPRVTTISCATGRAAAGAPQKLSAAGSRGESSKLPLSAWNHPYGPTSASLPSDSATLASGKLETSHHSHGDHTTGSDDTPSGSLITAVGGEDLAYTDGMRVTKLPLLISRGNRSSNSQRGMFASKCTADAGFTSNRLYGIRKTGEVTTLTNSTRWPVVDSAEMGTVAVKKYPLISLGSSSLSRRGSTSRTDLGAATGVEHGPAANPPRRRLTEFRNGDYMLQASFKSRVSATTAEDPHPETVEQRGRERQIQQSNEERRQRIQAFMARRKAEKKLEELRRAGVVGQKRQLEVLPGEQQQQPTLEVAPRLQTPVTVGCGLNAIKVSKRPRKALPKRVRPVRQSAPVACIIPEAVMAATAAVPDPVSLPQLGRGAVSAVKNKVRAVVVLMGSAGAEQEDLPVTLNDDEGGRRSSSGSIALSTAALGPLNAGTVVVRLNESSNTFRVQVPPDNTRFFSVDEFLLINDATAPKQVHEPLGRRSTEIASHVLSNGELPSIRLSSSTLTEMNRKFLAGVNVALLLASTQKAHHGSLSAVREVVRGVLSHMPSQGELFASIAFVSGGNTVDLLGDTGRPVRSAFSSSPLFGPTLESVKYVAVRGLGHMVTTVSKAYRVCNLTRQRQQPSDGLLVMSLILKQQRGGDVVLSSYLITDAGFDGSTYMAVLRKAQHTPFALFHSALGGSTLTTALVSVSVADSATLVPLLDVQHRLANVTNKPCHVGSVQRFLELAQQELQKGAEDERPDNRPNSGTNSTTMASEGQPHSLSTLSNTSESDSTSHPPSSSGHRGPGQQSGMRALLHKRLVESVVVAQSILDDPAGYHPKAVGEASRSRRASAPTVTARFSQPAGLPLTPATTPRGQPNSGDDATIKNTDVTVPRQCSLMSKAADSSTPAIAPAVLLPSHGTGAALAHSRSLSLAVADRAASHPTQLLVTCRPSDVFSVDLDAKAREKTPLSPPVTHYSKQIAQFCPLQQPTSSPAAGRPSVSISLSTEYVRRGNGSGAAQHTTRFMNFEDLCDSSSASVVGKPRVGTQLGKGDREEPKKFSPRSATEMTTEPLSVRHSAGVTEPSRRDKGASSNGAGGLAQELLGVSPGVVNGNGGIVQKRLQAAPARIVSNGRQVPSSSSKDPIDIPTAPDVKSIDSSLAPDVSSSVQQSSTLNRGESAPITTSTKVRTLVVVDPSCRETSNVTYDNTMVIATTEDDFEEYEVDEVREMVSGKEEPFRAKLLMELRDALLRGCNAAILSADSRRTGFSVQVLKSVVQMTFDELNREGARRSGRLSASIVKVKGESVVDLLRDSGEAEKLVIAISPLFGSCVHGATYSNIPSSAIFNTTIEAALHRDASDDNGRDHGFIFCSLLFKLQLEDESDVLVCSLVATFAGEHVGLYTSVLDRSPLVPRALFHYALGGPSYTIALLGISGKESRANQMLQVQRRLGEMSNRATHPGSVAKFVAGIRTDLMPNLIAKYENSRDQCERAATKELIERLAEMVKDADALLHGFDHHQPKAYLHEDQERGTTSASVASVNNPDSHSSATKASRSRCGNTSHVFNLPISTSAVGAVGDTTQQPANRQSSQRSLPCITAVNPEGAGDHIQSLVCYEQVLMGAGSVAVQGNSILCTSQGGMRYDSDEVIVCNEEHRSLSSKLMDQLVAKLLAGYHTGLLTSDSSYSAFTPLMLRRIVGRVLGALLPREGGLCEGSASTGSHHPSLVVGELHVSIALIKDDMTADLLPINANETYHRFEMDHVPLYGARVAGVTSHFVSTPQDFDNFLAVAIDNADPALQSADPGIMVVSLTLIQRVENPTNDVLVSSLLCTAVFDAVHHYERVLDADPSEPLELFHGILRGPCFSVALFGISDEEENPGKLLHALHGITQVRNRLPQVNSVSRYIQELQHGIVRLGERLATSSNEEEREYIVSRVKVAEHLLVDAEALRRNPFSTTHLHAFVPLSGAPGLRV
ncbi:hypothetical protein JKF63_02320 [Porcisia hertigi]|uniref:Uncharacterized protein n=1 Tax=Porcisia hertigi TaxID=2761500 RepID=A0A836IH33_9TRYP|nr:hypothetical protein JKF63_02320 [Porcisia hertigi]